QEHTAELHVGEGRGGASPRRLAARHRAVTGPFATSCRDEKSRAMYCWPRFWGTRDPARFGDLVASGSMAPRLLRSLSPRWHASPPPESTASHTVPRVPPLVARSSQQPPCGNVNPPPH